MNIAAVSKIYILAHSAAAVQPEITVAHSVLLSPALSMASQSNYNESLEELYNQIADGFQREAAASAAGNAQRPSSFNPEDTSARYSYDDPSEE